jgi:hypothetical protein
MLTEFIVVRSGMTLREALREIDRHECVIAVVSENDSRDADQVLGVLNPFSLTRVLANASRMHVSA